MYYLDKHIKYKTMYFELKNTDVNNKIGSGINKDIIDKVITDNNLSISYSIYYDECDVNKYNIVTKI